MRALIILVLVLGFASTLQAKSPEKCTVAWGRELLAAAEHQDDGAPTSVKGAVGDAMNEIRHCPAEGLPFKVLEDAAVGSGSKSGGGSGGSATRGTGSGGSSGTSSGAGGKKETAGSSGTRGPSVPHYTPATWQIVLGQLKSDLVAQFEELQRRCHGFSGNCLPSELTTWTRNLSQYLTSLGTEGVPEASVREAGDLFRSVAQASPEFRFALGVLEIIDQADPNQQRRLKEQVPSLMNELASKKGSERLEFLLKHPEELRPIFKDLLAVGGGRVVANGRNVVVGHDLTALSSLKGACEADQPARLSRILAKAAPLGVMLYPAESEGARDPHACLTASVVEPGSKEPGCRAGQRERCVRLVVREWLNPAAPGAPAPNCGSKEDEGPVPTARASFYSAGFSGCPDDPKLNGLVADAFDSFALQLRTRNASIEEAKLVQPGCLDVFEQVNPAWSAQLKATANQRPPIQLDDGHWEGFRQELAEALALQRVLGQISWVAPPQRTSLSIGWDEPTRNASHAPHAVTLRFDWNGVRVPPPAASLRFTESARRGCNLGELAFARTVAARATLWLLAAHFPELVPARFEPIDEGKTWLAAPLGLLFPGLPQAIDRRYERAAVLASVDAAFVTTSLLFVLSSVGERRAVARNEPGSSLHAANEQLTVGLGFGGAALVTRGVSFFW